MEDLVCARERWIQIRRDRGEEGGEEGEERREKDTTIHKQQEEESLSQISSLLK